VHDAEVVTVGEPYRGEPTAHASVATAEQPKPTRPATVACMVSARPSAMPAIGSSATNGPKTGSRSSWVRER
jgi:hypothetical protein